MSKIAIIGATGHVGSQLLEEALRRGHSVTAIARHASKLGPRVGVENRDIDVTDPQALQQALVGHDAVLSAARFADIAPEAIIDPVKRAGVKRLLVVGGAGSLRLPDGTLVIESPNFPDSYKPEAIGGGAYLEALRREQTLDWSFLSPSAEFVEGPRTEKFRLGKDDLMVGIGGRSWISFADFAIAMLNELEKPSHSRQRFTVGY